MPHLFEIVFTNKAIRPCSNCEGEMELTTPVVKRWARVVATVAGIISLWAVASCNAKESFSPSDLTFHDGFGSRKGDRRTYVLTGCCWIRGIRFGDPDQFVTKWIGQHPQATVTPVSKMTLMSDELVYVSVKDGDTSLNVELIRAGIYPGGAMADMVDNDDHLIEIMRKPELAFARKEFEKGRAETPQEHRPKRFISDEEYQRFSQQVTEAEKEARAEKLGIWSDAMMEEREADGYR
jgi:endonuclease YncB( thermonuclease family)